MTVATARRADWAFVLRHPAHFIAFGGGVGLLPVAPGTFGTLLAFPLHGLLAPWLGTPGLLALTGVFFLVGTWACGVTGRALGVADHGGMVWDEIVAFLLVLALVPPWGYWPAASFLVFRVFDITKPQPIRYYDRTLKGGFGVMFDDLLAAFYTLLVLAVAKNLLG